MERVLNGKRPVWHWRLGSGEIPSTLHLTATIWAGV